jgi:hypothetical protein
MVQNKRLKDKGKRLKDKRFLAIKRPHLAAAGRDAIQRRCRCFWLSRIDGKFTIFIDLGQFYP